MKIIICKFVDWDFALYLKPQHPEGSAIRNVVSGNREHNFMLIGDGQNFNHFKADRILFYNFDESTIVRSLFSALLKIELATLFRPSVVVCLGTINLIPLGLSSILAGSRFVPVITGEISYGMERVSKYVKEFTSILFRVIFQKANRILVLGEKIKKDLVCNYRVDPKKIFIYRYRAAEIFMSDLQKAQANPLAINSLRKSLNPDGPVVLTVSRISREKGLIYLVEASKIVVKKIPNVRIIIKGYSGSLASASENKYYKELMELIRQNNLQENVAIIEASYHSEIPKYMLAADVFVLPSLTEGSPLVVLEALAAGLPIVATKVGGIPDILQHGKNSLLTEPMDAPGLAEAIVRALSEKELREQISENGLKTSQFIWENDFENSLRKSIFIDC